MFYYPRKAAFRVGNSSATSWNDANVGTYSTSWGDSTIASGSYSTAGGAFSSATGTASTALGISAGASGYASFSMGQVSLAYGARSIAMGMEVIAGNNGATAGVGDYSMAVGLGDNTAGSSATYPQLRGNNSVAFFGGDQAGVNVTSNNTAAFLGLSMIINPDSTSASPAIPSTAGVGLELHVEGDAGVTRLCDTSGANCATPAQIAIAVSDERLKKNIKPISDVFTKLESLKPVEFDWRWDEFTNIADRKDHPHSFGLIAQDVQKSFPEAVIENSDGFLTVDYKLLTAPLIEAVKILRAENDDLKQRLDAQEAEMQKIRDDLKLIKSGAGTK
jgi:hypothetical protein